MMDAFQKTERLEIPAELWNQLSPEEKQEIIDEVEITLNNRLVELTDYERALVRDACREAEDELASRIGKVPGNEGIWKIILDTMYLNRKIDAVIDLQPITAITRKHLLETASEVLDYLGIDAHPINDEGFVARREGKPKQPVEDEEEQSSYPIDFLPDLAEALLQNIQKALKAYKVPRKIIKGIDTLATLNIYCSTEPDSFAGGRKFYNRELQALVNDSLKLIGYLEGLSVD